MKTGAVTVQSVSKRFSKGAGYDSLRDLLPAIFRQVFRRRRVTTGSQDFLALDDVSFEVAPGEAFGIIGHNGAGKSTMLKLLAHIMQPTRGTVTVGGRLAALIELGAGFHPDLTGRENIFLNGTILGMKRAEITRKFDEIVEFSGIAEFLDMPLKRYSSGMHARLGFSVAAHLDPDVLVIDEVLSVGDFLFQRKSLEKMRGITRSGTTVVFVSHNLRAVAELCRTGILLDHGRVAARGPMTEVVQRYLERGAAAHAQASDADVVISRVAIRNAQGEGVQFMAGETVWLDVDVTARRSCAKLAVVLDVEDANHYHVFDTSTQRLDGRTFAVEAGQTLRCTFELSLHLAAGTFHFGATVYRYDIEKAYHQVFPAATVFIASERDVRGVVNLHPKVIAGL
jgi:ABC-type polysaccharide/polyol phosphate transport system ATPase subunit